MEEFGRYGLLIKDLFTLYNLYDLSQVDQQMFEQTQTSSLVSAEWQAILNYYGFNWNSVQWSDLLKPFYSGLAARLFNQLKTNYYSKFSSVSEQANFWKTNYRLNGDETAFVNKLNSLQSSNFIFYIYIHLKYVRQFLRIY